MAIYLVAGKLLERALQSACRSSATNLKIIMSMSIPNEGVAANPLLVAHHVDPRQDGGKKKKFAGGAVKYMECLKNHAAGIGGSATDGCGEFLAGGEEGSLEALKCCACNCHRNFHRKIHVQQPSVDPAGVLRMKGAYDYDLEERRRKAAADEGEGEVGMRKRFRSKFSQEQKEKMQRFAEKSGWKLQKAGDAEVRSFCEEIGVKRKVLKVWMHNNKYHFANNPNPNPNSPFAN